MAMFDSICLYIFDFNIILSVIFYFVHCKFIFNILNLNYNNKYEVTIFYWKIIFVRNFLNKNSFIFNQIIIKVIKIKDKKYIKIIEIRNLGFGLTFKIWPDQFF